MNICIFTLIYLHILTYTYIIHMYIYKKKLYNLYYKLYFLYRKYTKLVQEARSSHDDEAVKKSINDYEEALSRYIPVLMAQVKGVP